MESVNSPEVNITNNQQVAEIDVQAATATSEPKRGLKGWLRDIFNKATPANSADALASTIHPGMSVEQSAMMAADLRKTEQPAVTNQSPVPAEVK